MRLKVLRFTMLHQNLDGSWYYSFDPDTWKAKKQIDFHQGYVLETIKEFVILQTLILVFMIKR